MTERKNVNMKPIVALALALRGQPIKQVLVDVNSVRIVTDDHEERTLLYANVEDEEPLTWYVTWPGTDRDDVVSTEDLAKLAVKELEQV